MRRFIKKVFELIDKYLLSKSKRFWINERIYGVPDCKEYARKKLEKERK